MYFATIQDGELAQILIIIAGMLAGFFAVFKVMQSSADKDREAERIERISQNKAFIVALKDVADSNYKIASATEQGNKEAKQRNGHLAELTIQSKEDTLKAIEHLTVQRIDKQYVAHEHVANKE